ncbi:MAG: hypothetical protein V5A34_08505 [Halapricum sp.]
MSGIHHAPQDGSFDSEGASTGTVRVARDGDRVTLYLDAPGMSDDDRSTHWLTADAESFCDLGEMR